LRKILITGSSGFVGKNLSSYLSNKFEIFSQKLNSDFNINEDIVIHLAGIKEDKLNAKNSNLFYQINTIKTFEIFNSFLNSDASLFIYFSSVKAVTEKADDPLTEFKIPNPKTFYGLSKLKSEEYILSKNLSKNKKFYILRPSLIHGTDNIGNLNQLYKFVIRNHVWPFGCYNNKRSFCSIDNLCFVVNELIDNDNIPSGIFNISDDDPISIKEIINIISNLNNLKVKNINIPPFIIKLLSKFGDSLNLKLNTNSLSKITDNFIISNHKIKSAIGKPLPLTTKEGILKTFNSYLNSV
jgi:nucleoside-diphosphate-sugar epimerase